MLMGISNVADSGNGRVVRFPKPFESGPGAIIPARTWC